MPLHPILRHKLRKDGVDPAEAERWLIEQTTGSSTSYERVAIGRCREEAKYVGGRCVQEANHSGPHFTDVIVWRNVGDKPAADWTSAEIDVLREAALQVFTEVKW